MGDACEEHPFLTKRERRNTLTDLKYLETSREDPFGRVPELRLVGKDPAIIEVNRLIARLAPSNLAVLVSGETGTGKDIVARLLHKLSPRASEPFIKVNCPSIPETLIEGELFGYERGAFTGAHTARPGRFEMAHSGTIFLDEICETSLHVQSKLLQVLDGEPFMRLGGTTPVRSNTRVVSATNLPLDAAVRDGRLREDILFRLSEAVVSIPPLRDRRGDIPLLADYFNYKLSAAHGKEYRPLPTDCVASLQEEEWPGNVRELLARVRKYVVTETLDALLTPDPDFVPETARAVKRKREAARTEPVEEPKIMPLKEAVKHATEAAERALIEEALRYTLWNRRKAAKLLKTSYSSLLRRIDAYGIGK